MLHIKGLRTDFPQGIMGQHCECNAVIFRERFYVQKHHVEKAMQSH